MKASFGAIERFSFHPGGDTLVARVVRAGASRGSSRGSTRSLGELATHEEQLLAGLGELYPNSSRRLANFCHSSPAIFAEEGALAVYDLVVRQGQDEVLAVGVDRPECQPVVVHARWIGSWAR